MTVQCPQGHASETTDFCDVCGEPIAASAPSPASGPASAPGSVAAGAVAAVPPPVPQAAQVAHKACPNCGDENVAESLFCEECGYDFTTGQLPTPAPPAASPVLTAPAGAAWVAEIWVDPDWFASQEAEGACPSGGVPRVVALQTSSALIGRASRSRDITPEIDCGDDGAISHRHAQLFLAHDQWVVEDLGSVNGTYLGKPDGTYPTEPVLPHASHEVADDERIYLGAWTRIVVRRATADEQAGHVS